jgi:Glycosyltransferase like family
MNWTVIVAVDNETVLKNCLLSSPDIRSASEIIVQTGYSSAASAYNAGIKKAAKSDILVFVHQDVYLAEGWLARVERAVEAVSSKDPNWGVMGVWGIDHGGRGAGHLYCTAGGRELGEPFDGGKEIRSLDEVVLILRKSSGLYFDERLPGFHLYGTDICLEAAKHGMKSYAIAGFCIHNSDAYGMLPWQFWKCCLFLRRKWRSQLPIIASCAEITFWGWPMIRWNIVQAANIVLRRHKPGKHVPDPAQLYREMVRLRRSSALP